MSDNLEDNPQEPIYESTRFWISVITAVINVLIVVISEVYPQYKSIMLPLLGAIDIPYTAWIAARTFRSTKK